MQKFFKYSYKDFSASNRKDRFTDTIIEVKKLGCCSS